MGLTPVADGAEFATLVDDIDQLGFDSIWLPEILTAPALDPLVGLAFAAAHNAHLKLGTTMLLPGRNLVRLAKELAGLDRLSGGRLLVTFVPGLPRQPESGATGVAGGDKGRVMDEMLPVLRRLWAGETVTHHGEAADFEGVTVSPLPVQEPLEFWTGGMVPAALRRCGRLADGWLPSACTPGGGGRGQGGHRPGRGRGRAHDLSRAFRGVDRLRRRARCRRGPSRRWRRCAAGSTPNMSSRSASTDSGPCSRSSSRWASPSSWSGPCEQPGFVADRARSPG